ncbi:hypothetical protein SAMN03097699_1621 [Flavobacteriaceae bacterium MAR_2010_188]|nr:hypothetical protein SAMN03097699_1621 [Flavobacteriaceae bacterium MAR_2010_188]
MDFIVNEIKSMAEAKYPTHSAKGISEINFRLD